MENVDGARAVWLRSCEESSLLKKVAVDLRGCGPLFVSSPEGGKGALNITDTTIVGARREH